MTRELVEYELHFPDVNLRTLQRDLKSLLEKGLILEIGGGPTDNNRYFQLKVSWLEIAATENVAAIKDITPCAD